MPARVRLALEPPRMGRALLNANLRMSSLPMRRLTNLLGAGLMLSNLAHAAGVLYVSVSEDQKLARFDIDEATGGLTPAESLSVEGTPGAMGVAPDGKTLYVSLRSINSLGSYRVNLGDGQLTPLNVVKAPGNAAFVSTDRTGRYLFTAYYNQGQIAVHRLQEDGSIGELLQTIPTAEKAHCIVVDRSNRFAFVPHTGAEKIFQFLFDAETGQLTPNSAGPVDTSDAPRSWGPRHLWLHPTENLAFVSLEQGSAIAAYRLDPATGTLSLVTTGDAIPERVSTIPHEYSETNTTADIELTPDGRFAYVSNRGHDSIAGFEVNPQTGQLNSLGQFPTERTPRSFNIHPSGRSLYAAGQHSGNLDAYNITESGHLEQFQTLPVGNGPAWVQVVVPSESN